MPYWSVLYLALGGLLAGMAIAASFLTVGA